MDYAATDIRALDLVDDEFSSRSAGALPRSAPVAAINLSGIERSVVYLSRDDGLASIPDLPTWRGWFGRAFRTKQPNQLANEQLEALRRYSILARVYGDPGDDALGQFLGAGYTLEQADLVRRLLQQRLPARRDKSSNGPAWVVILLISAGTFFALQSAVGEVVISFICSALAFVTLASLAVPRDRAHR